MSTSARAELARCCRVPAARLQHATPPHEATTRYTSCRRCFTRCWRCRCEHTAPRVLYARRPRTPPQTTHCHAVRTHSARALLGRSKAASPAHPSLPRHLAHLEGLQDDHLLGVAARPRACGGEGSGAKGRMSMPCAWQTHSAVVFTPDRLRSNSMHTCRFIHSFHAPSEASRASRGDADHNRCFFRVPAFSSCHTIRLGVLGIQSQPECVGLLLHSRESHAARAKVGGWRGRVRALVELEACVEAHRGARSRHGQTFCAGPRRRQRPLPSTCRFRDEEARWMAGERRRCAARRSTPCLALVQGAARAFSASRPPLALVHPLISGAPINAGGNTALC